MEKLTVLLLLMFCGPVFSADGKSYWASWADSSTLLDLMGVKEKVQVILQTVDDLKDMATSTVNSATTYVDNVSGKLKNFVNILDRTNLYEFADTTLRTALVQALPEMTCARGVKVQLKSSSLLINNSKLRLRHDFTVRTNVREEKKVSKAAKTNPAAEKEESIETEELVTEIELVFKKVRIQYDFRFKNNVVDKGGKLVLTQRGDISVMITAKTVKGLDKFLELIKSKTDCALKILNVKCTIKGDLEHSVIKYYSVGIGLTQRYVSGIIDLVENEVQANMEKALTGVFEDTLRKLKVVCRNKDGKKQEQGDCNDLVFRNLVQ